MLYFLQFCCYTSSSKEINTEFGEFKADYDKTLEWGPYAPTIETIEADAPETVSEEADWID